MGGRLTVFAPGWPGITPRWTSSAKSGVGTSLGPNSRLWFTISHGIVNELYYPRIDRACTRDMGLIVTDGNGWMSEEKRDATSEVHRIAVGVPAYHLRNVSRDGRYEIVKEILSDPCRPVLLQRTVFTPLVGIRSTTTGSSCSWRPTSATAAPAIPRGSTTTRACRCSLRSATARRWRWPRRLRGATGQRGSPARPMAMRPCASDGRLDACYDRAENGNVALTAEIGLRAEPQRVPARGGVRHHARKKRRTRPARRSTTVSPRPGRNTSRNGPAGRTACSRSTCRSTTAPTGPGSAPW